MYDLSPPLGEGNTICIHLPYFYPKFILPSHACQCHTNIILAMQRPITSSYKNWPCMTATGYDAVCPVGGPADFIHLNFSLSSNKEIRRCSSCEGRWAPSPHRRPNGHQVTPKDDGSHVHFPISNIRYAYGRPYSSYRQLL